MGTTLTFLVFFCTYPVTFALFLHPDGWTHLPYPQGRNGIRSRLTSCVGCHKPIHQSTGHHQCVFATTGFTQDDQRFVPCTSAYHLGCISVGEPFRTRLPAGRGLSYPKVRITPPFICEACTVRAQIGGELTSSGRHLTLVMLERMRMIDQANAWSSGSHGGYQSGLRRLSRFQSDFGVPILQATPLVSPPRSPSIGMMWAQQHYAIQTPKGRHSQNSDRILFQTARLLRSAGAHFYAWDRQIAYPDRALRDSRQRVTLMAGVIPSDELGYTFMTTGMAKRMGDQSKPPIALTLRQVIWVMQRLDAKWEECHTPTGRREIAAAAVSHLFAWLGWLRSFELFSLTWDDVTITRPRHGPRVGLALGIGVIELRLLPETKTNRTKVADIVIAYACASGLTLGLWLERLRCLWPDAPAALPIIRGSTGTPWTSHYFCTHHLYVWLRQMRAEGDPFLLAFTDLPGHRIEDKYYSMGTYRRGGRSSCTKHDNGTLKATPAEVYEHGRWTVKQSKENMPTRYNEYALDDRINITLLCM